MSKLDMIHGIE